MKLRSLCFAWLAATLVALGCAHSEREVASRRPLPDVKLLEEETFSGHDRIIASGVVEYIAAYQDAGWLRALSDARRVGNGQSVFRCPLRVKDVFCFYYLQRQGKRLASEWKSDATWSQRDAVIATVVADIERRRATNGAASTNGDASGASDLR
jgi:hypothetical protein